MFIKKYKPAIVFKETKGPDETEKADQPETEKADQPETEKADQPKSGSRKRKLPSKITEHVVNENSEQEGIIPKRKRGRPKKIKA